MTIPRQIFAKLRTTEMKIWVLQIFLSLILLAASLWGLWSFSEQESFSQQLSPFRAQNLIQIFEKKATPLAQIELSTLVPAQGPELKLWASLYQRPMERGFQKWALWIRARKVCAPDLLPELSKEKIWVEFECGLRANLSENFFVSAPFLSPNGESFAFLAWKSGQPQFQQREWLQTHLHFFHLLERKTLPPLDSSDAADQVVRSLTVESLDQLSLGSLQILSDSFFLVRRGTDSFSNASFGANEIRYLVFSKQAWLDFAKEKGWVVSEVISSECPNLIENLCWSPTWKPHPLTRQAWMGLLLLGLIGFVTAFFGFVWTLRRRAHDSDRKKFALQALAHELRTPVTGLVLNSENLIEGYDRLPSDLQESSLRISNEVQRLVRLTEMSLMYLKSSDDNLEQLFRPSRISSLRDFIGNCLQEFRDEIQIEEKEDLSAEFDPFWVSLCLQNLVSNALRHGRKPVVIRYQIKDSQLSIAVQDSGQLPTQDLNLLAQVGFSSQKGHGLGLQIVTNIVQKMKIQLKVSTSPTCFEIILPRQI